MNSLKSTKSADRIEEYGPEERERGSLILERLDDFIARNSHRTGAWPYIIGRAADLYRAGRPISVRGILEDAREMDFADADGRKTVVDNNFCAPISRLLLKAHPEYDGLIETRRSVFDVLI